MSQKEKPICPYCDSEEVICDANAIWNDDTQQWEVQSTFDSGFCQSCESETKRFNWILI